MPRMRGPDWSGQPCGGLGDNGHKLQHASTSTTRWLSLMAQALGDRTLSNSARLPAILPAILPRPNHGCFIHNPEIWTPWVLHLAFLLGVSCCARPLIPFGLCIRELSRLVLHEVIIMAAPTAAWLWFHPAAVACL